MLTFKVEGWVNEITKDKWGTNVVMRFVEDESQEKFPQRMLITAAKKKEDLIPNDLGRNDKISVTFAPYLNEGESNYSHRVYRINRSMIQELTVLQSAEKPNVVENGSENDDDCPF